MTGRRKMAKFVQVMGIPVDTLDEQTRRRITMCLRLPLDTVFKLAVCPHDRVEKTIPVFNDVRQMAATLGIAPTVICVEYPEAQALKALLDIIFREPALSGLVEGTRVITKKGNDLKEHRYVGWITNFV
jgi:hypothetical protein